ncbi:transporter [Caballeronia megalochromosomata]|nr:transporter [Caballeronia megalochromosomata]
MSDIKLFKLVEGVAVELDGHASDLEKPLQSLIEQNLEALLGIRFLATEYATGKTHSGRIDSLGLDENNSPVILEYKRSVGENVINQGLFYLDWLMDHQAEFKLLVMDKLGHEAAALIDWSVPRLLCIAADFTRYDVHAVQQINRNVELIRYRRFGADLLLFELANATSVAKPKAAASKAQLPTKPVFPSVSGTLTEQVPPITPTVASKSPSPGGDKSYAEWVEQYPPQMLELLTSMEDFIGSLGDDVQRKELKLYVAFKRLKNFASIVPQKARFLLFLHLDPDKVDPLPGNARDARKFGHWGTGDLELSIGSFDEFEQSKPLILTAYEGRSGSQTQ